jgi:hypothetical protein
LELKLTAVQMTTLPLQHKLCNRTHNLQYIAWTDTDLVRIVYTVLSFSNIVTSLLKAGTPEPEKTSFDTERL